MTGTCRFCKDPIRQEAEVGLWVHWDGFATCFPETHLGAADATFAEPEEGK